MGKGRELEQNTKEISESTDENVINYLGWYFDDVTSAPQINYFFDEIISVPHNK